MSLARWLDAYRLAERTDHLTLLMAAMINESGRQAFALRRVHPRLYAEVRARLDCHECREALRIPDGGCPHGRS